MTLHQWFSNDSAWAIFRRGVIVVGILLVLAVFAQLLWGMSVSRYVWGASLVPAVLTVLNLLDQLGKEKKSNPAGNKK